MMGDIFLKLLNMSIAAGWLILAVLALRLLLRKAPRWLHCLLWGIVAVRLACPFSFESVFSLVPSAETVQSHVTVEGGVSNYVPSIDSRMPVIVERVNPLLSEAFAYEEAYSASPLQIYSDIAGIVWCCGAILLLMYAVLSRFKVHLMVREAVRREGNIYLCDAVVSPFILGLVNPCIYLPSGMDMERADYVIAHEQAHLKRKDHWWKVLGYLLLAVYWFHPLCWIAYIFLCKDIEFACDEKVIRDMTLNEKKEYAKALLSCSRQGRIVLACPLAFGEVSVKERIQSVLNYKKAAFWILFAGIAACVIVGVCFLTNPLREYQVRVTIPAGCTDSFSYSDEEICPKGGTITLYAGEGLGDTEIVLLLTEGEGTEVYTPTYITPGWPVKLEVERGSWYRIGVNVQNSTGEDKDVYVSVRNVELRIADAAQDGGDINLLPTTDNAEMSALPATVANEEADALSAEEAEQAESSAQRYDMGDLDGNGENEYLLISQKEDPSIFNGHLSFYFNGESIYEYDDPLMMGPGTAEYLDLDEDGEKEIFFTFNPYVNSAPLVEYAVLKQDADGWRALEMFQKEDMLDNSFPISCKYGEEDNTMVISCEGTDQQIVYNFEAYYKDLIEEFQGSDLDTAIYVEVLEGNHTAGEDFGGVAAWGIWDIRSGSYEGRNCLVAAHGLLGPGGSWDLIGTVDICFNYDREGRIHILGMGFRGSFAEENQTPIDSSQVTDIVVTNGNNGEKLSYSIIDSSYAFQDLLSLYEQLHFDAETKPNTRVGYSYTMSLYDAEGELIHMVTPYKDGFAVDDTFYLYDGDSGYDHEAVELMNLMDRLFYP
ncbi:MAG: M56 family metallopeptidase [Candidatus Gastranaerophilales bacterium]|nr:M56 family metallopeptidase [Candidatus Gastranaerophilales bacterium]